MDFTWLSSHTRSTQDLLARQACPNPFTNLSSHTQWPILQLSPLCRKLWPDARPWPHSLGSGLLPRMPQLRQLNGGLQGFLSELWIGCLLGDPSLSSPQGPGLGQVILMTSAVS